MQVKKTRMFICDNTLLTVKEQYLKGMYAYLTTAVYI